MDKIQQAVWTPERRQALYEALNKANLSGLKVDVIAFETRIKPNLISKFKDPKHSMSPAKLSIIEKYLTEKGFPIDIKPAHSPETIGTVELLVNSLHEIVTQNTKVIDQNGKVIDQNGELIRMIHELQAHYQIKPKK